ncbi:D-alanyl-D-alanine carboxypeptidase family protein [Dokdonella fugitiva]|jgi:D-alanyl-D-alanine carboxypeptidase (penicillin-binding protein 5/6)|uniref:D-alanyl-D-alanine carboxypeptidase (Penicillin-binding protein 5/6) n=1 Tax=Dokdonella fugitiva TaxID=328517 RepID=A0A4R2IAU9_9GAMM|nr:serine hydrolase [Dokdonella fugitiva]MBA8883499.1 D-alanyl-D-alanine carboxypeptidase (penicillin-binding protein 5/6) [Dokdonella fugitiva]TCO41242.1 D-alanyl-D-alanine carboxypeptidase (penicillin-binding protein 5/6) [Dokdonella fugitiva]
MRASRTLVGACALVLAFACTGARPSFAVAPGEAPIDAYPDVAAAYWVELDGRPLWAGRADARLPMASLAKLMTALVAVEQGDLDAWAAVSAAAAAETGTRIGLRRGERVTRRDLLHAAMVRSANDACRALADAVGATIDARDATGAFVARMNARATALGLADTHYANPCGHDDPAQYTSARDLAVLARAVLAEPTLADIAQHRDLRITTDRGRALAARSTNALLDGLPGARGLKTGTTPAAGRCLVAVVERDGHRVLAVLLHAPERWWDSVALVELAFEAASPPRP